MTGNMMRSLRRPAVSAAAAAAVLASMIGVAQPGAASPAYHLVQIKTSTGIARHARNRGAPGGRWHSVTKSKERAEDTCSLVYQCRLPLSSSTVNHLADLLRRHLKAIRSRWRILPPGKIAVIVLAVLRHDQRLADMAGGSSVSESTVRRWRDELIALLAAQAPPLDRTLRKVARHDGEVVLIDGTFPLSAAPEGPTGATTPANTAATACTSSP